MSRAARLWRTQLVNTTRALQTAITCAGSEWTRSPSLQLLLAYVNAYAPIWGGYSGTIRIRTVRKTALCRSDGAGLILAAQASGHDHAHHVHQKAAGAHAQIRR